MAANPQVLQVGYVARAHGLRGELGVKTFDPASEVLFEVPRVLLRLRSGEERSHTVEGCRASAKELLLTLEEIEGRSAAESLVGATVFVHREDLEPPAEGEYFLGDLIGLEASAEDGTPLGRVEEVWETGPVPNLVIRKDGAEHLVPFADDFVLDVKLDARRVTVRLPELMD